MEEISASADVLLIEAKSRFFFFGNSTRASNDTQLLEN